MATMTSSPEHRRAPTSPARLNHVAYVIRDAHETADFYGRILGLQMTEFIIDDKVPSTGDAFPYVHLFFELGDGSSLAFFESIGLPEPAKSTHPAYDVFNHLALDVGTKEEVDRWAEHLRSHGVSFIGPVDHTVIYSIYFHDPNGIRLEMTCNTLWKPDPGGAKEGLGAWTRAKAEAKQLGGNPEPLHRLIAERRAKHTHRDNAEH